MDRDSIGIGRGAAGAPLFTQFFDESHDSMIASDIEFNIIEWGG